MKILFITYENPIKRNNGDRKYTFDILSNLHNEKNDIHLVSFYENEEDKRSDLRCLCDKVSYVPFTRKNKLALLLSLYPAFIASRKSSLFIHSVIEIVENEAYDCIFINHFKLSYLIEPLKKYSVKKVLITHNAEAVLSKSLYQYTRNLFKKIIYFQDYIKTIHYERRYLEQFDCLTAISDFDSCYFKQKYKNDKVCFLPPLIINNILPPKLESSHQIIICGSFYWEPKRENLLQLLNCRNFGSLYENSIELIVVGNAPQSFVDKVNRTYKGVTMTGFVDDTIEYYKSAQIALIPELLGGGFKLKIAEAVSCNRAIIAIKRSMTDLVMTNGVHYIEADSFEEMITKVIELHDDKDKISQLISNASLTFSERYSKEAIEKSLQEILN